MFYKDKETPYPEENSVIGNYNVGSMIVATNCSVVYTGMDQFGNKVILKFLKITELSEKLANNEIEILRSLKHSHIVSFIDDFKYLQYHCLVMEYAHFGTLDQLYDPSLSFGLSESTVQSIAIQLLETLEYLHHQHIWHRDLKLKNILVFCNDLDFPFIKIADFGLAAYVTDGVSPTERVGSLGYVAPEVVKGLQYDEKIDLWAVGVIIYHLLSGEFPFPNDLSFESRRMLLMGRYTFLFDRWSTRSREAINFIENLLVVDPTKRMSATDALSHPWLTSFKPPCQEINDVENLIDPLQLSDALVPSIST